MYEIREVELKNGQHVKRRLIISFDDPANEIIGVFLMSDAPIFQFELIDDVRSVLSGNKQPFQYAGNRCELEVDTENTIITDLFAEKAEDAAMPSVTIRTEQLLKYMEMWRSKLTAFQQK